MVSKSVDPMLVMFFPSTKYLSGYSVHVRVLLHTDAVSLMAKMPHAKWFSRRLFNQVSVLKDLLPQARGPIMFPRNVIKIGFKN